MSDIGERAEETDRVISGRLLPNLAANFGYFLFSIFVGLWYAPFLIGHLGTASYGIIPLVTSITNYMTIITTSLHTAVSRYLTISMTQGRFDEANEYFNTSFFGSLLMAAVLAPPVVWATMSLNDLISVPNGRTIEAQLLFLLTAASFLLNTVGTTFGVSTYYLNRFDLRNLLNLAQRLVSIGLVLWLFSRGTPQLWMVGVGLVAGTIVVWAGDVLLWRRLTPQLKISRLHFRWSAFRKLTFTGGWASVDSIGVILYTGVELLVVNRMFGAEAAGRYAAVLQWSLLLRSLTWTAASVFGPTVLRHYAHHDMDALVMYLRRAVKFVGLIIALPIGVICGLSTPLLVTWLGPEFADLSGLMTLMTLHLSVNLAVMPLFRAQMTTNRLRLPAVLTVVMGFGNLILAVFLAGPCGWGMHGVAAAGALLLTAKNIFFTPLYVARILGSPWTTFLVDVIPISLSALLIAAVSGVISALLDLAGWGRLFAAGLGIAAVYFAAAYRIILGPSEREMLRRMNPWARLRAQEGI